MTETQAVEPSPEAQPVAVQSLLDQILTPEELSPYVKCLIYGDPGSGKTVFAASAPKPLIIDTENSSRSILDFPDLARHVKILKVQSFNDLNTLFWHLMNGDIPDVETVVIDTISELQRRNLDEIMMRAHAKDNSRSPFLPFQGDYKLSTESMRKMVTMFRDLPYNLVVTAHRIEDKDDTGRVFVRPEVTPKLAQTMKGVFDLQAFMTYETNEDGEFVNFLQTRQTRNVEAKSRLKYLPTTIEMPRFEHIAEAHKRSLTELQAYDTVDHTPEPEVPNTVSSNETAETPNAAFTLNGIQPEGDK